MTTGLSGAGGGGSGPRGYTYGAVIIGLTGRDGVRISRDDVLAQLRRLRFTGWLAPEQDGWLVAMAGDAAVPGDGAVAGRRRGVIGVGEAIAERSGGTVLVLRVVLDRQLLLAAWAGGEEVGRYLSDPSFGLPSGDDTLPDPIGVDHAAGLAAACGRPEQADRLADTLAEELDAETGAIESERLSVVLRLLGLPDWVVAASSLPKDVPTGPRAREMTRLGAGRDGVAGWLSGRAAGVVRRRRPPPPPVGDAPRGGPELDPWLF